MSVRIKILIVICLTFLALLGILYFISQRFLLQDAIVTEEKSTTQDVTRLLAALDDQTAVMDATVSDWAPWDDTYEFISSGDTGYIDSNLPNNAAFTNIGVELMLFINNSGQIVFGKMVDFNSGAEIPIPESLYREIQAGSRLLSHKDPTDKMAGILSLPEGPMIIASQPIVSSLGEGPIRGTLIMGRRLDEAEIAKLSQRTQLSISAFPFNDEVLPEDVALARNSLVGGRSIFIAPQSNTIVSGYTLVTDVYGNPVLILRVDTPREAVTQAKVSVRTLGLAMLAIGIVLGLVAMLLFERMVIIRLTSLNSNVKKIGSHGTTSSRVEATGNDEIFVLATSVNSMLDSLEKSRAKERESEKRFRALTEAITEGFVFHIKGQIVDANPALLRMFGYEEVSELEGRGLLEFISPESRDLVLKRIQSGSSESYETLGLRRDGTVFPVEASARLYDYRGRTVRMMTIRDITERKRAEAALQEAEVRYRALVEQIPAIVYTDSAVQTGQTLYISPQVKTILGYDPQEWMADNNLWINIMHLDDRQRVSAEYAHANETGKPFNAEYRLIARDGRVVWMHDEAVLMHGQSGNPLFWQGILLDITERRQAEDTLQKSEQFLRQTIDLVPHFIFAKDMESRFLLVNKAVADAYGTTTSGIVGKSDIDFSATPEQASHFHEDDVAVIQGGHAKFIPEEPITDAQGNTRYLQTTKIPFQFGPDNVPGILGVSIDITERKRAEEALRDSEARYRAVLQQSLEAIYLYDVETQHVFEANPAFLNLLGYNAKEANLLTLYDIVAHDRANIDAYLQQILSSGGISLGERLWRRKDGKTVQVEVTANKVKQGDRNLVFLVARDITERKRTEEKIRSVLEQKDTLLREVHHRVKNNLQAIISLMEMHATQIEDAGMRQFLKELEEQARTMSLVYEQLYQSENLAQVDMALYLQKLASNVLEAFAGGRAIKLDMKIAPVSLDVSQAMPCGLIVNELLTNSLKHAFPPGFRGKPAIRIALKKDVKLYRLTVGDNGIGLPAGTDWQKGKALGLRLVHLWAEHQMGGRLDRLNGPGTNYSLRFDV